MWRASAILCYILMTAATARPGEIVKNDDTTQAGQIIAFDGKDLQLRKVYGSNQLISVPIRDVTRVQFHEGRGPEIDFTPQRDKSRLPPIWQIKLSTGDTVSGEIYSWSDSRVSLHLQLDDPVLSIPVPIVREIWRVAPELVRKALDLKTTSSTQDVVYAVKENDVIAARGTALGIENNALAFVYEGEKKTIKIDRVLGVVLAPQKASTSEAATAAQPRPHKLVLVNADVLTGRWTKLKDLDATFETSWNQTIQLRAETIWRIETSDKSAVFLSDLKPVRVDQTPYFDRLIPWRADAALDGGPLQLNDGHKYVRGISMHSRCVLEYDLDAKFDTFAARLGFEPIPQNLPPGRVAVRVLADGSARFQEADFRSDQPPKDLNIDVHGVKRLTLQVEFGQGQDVNDRVVFANARLMHSTGGN